VRDLVAGYGETEILHGVSADVAAGEIVTVLGPNGAGKSTLIKAIIGILKPTRGTIRFQDQEIAGREPESLVTEGLAYVPQNHNIFPSLTVLENLQMGAITRRPGLLHVWGGRLLELVRIPLKKARRGESARGGTVDPRARGTLDDGAFEGRVQDIVTLFPNLKPKLRRRAGSLSGGEQQMVAFAKALILDPVLLLIDEPSAGLAPKLVTLIFAKIQEINGRGTSILLVEQNARKALSMSHRAYVLEMGRNRYSGSGESLLHDPEVGRLYLGG
jgi:neutral amino acid transport system ATP-binding protein